MTNDSIGIDVSKAKLDVHRLCDGTRQTFDNTRPGLKTLRDWLAQSPPSRVVYEATGPYHGAFERICSGHLPLVKVNPLQARRFAQARGTRAKTDTVDARILALMGGVIIFDKPTPLTNVCQADFAALNRRSFRLSFRPSSRHLLRSV